MASFDRDELIRQLARLELDGGRTGLIPIFGGLITQLPSTLWNHFSNRLLAVANPSGSAKVEQMLVEAAHECGYHTGYGILQSSEWQTHVEPHLDGTPEDVLHGAFALVSGFGWAKAEIVHLVPREQLIVHAYDYFEADVVEYGSSPTYTAHLLRGITAAFMDLAYGAPYPNGYHTFLAAQTKGIECGDGYGEFVVVRK